MKAWIYQGKVQTILPSEADPALMGKIYDVSREDSDNLESARQLAKSAQLHLESLERRLAWKLQREQGQ